MTGSNLAPDTARQISTLKRRVTDLERMLDRIRRLIAREPAASFDTPYAQVDGGTIEVLPGETVVLTPTDRAVPDLTGHIVVDHDGGNGWFLYLVPGYYEIGGTIRFLDNEGVDDSDRWLAIQSSGSDGIADAAPILVLRVTRADGGSVLSGSRIVYVDQSAVRHWQIAAGHDSYLTLDVLCEAFWTRFVTTGDPPPPGDL